MIEVVIIGAGWRSEFYLRIAKALPEYFRVNAICVRNEVRAKELAQKFSVKIVNTIPEALSEPFDFVVNCIKKEDLCDMAISLADAGHFVLCETPIMVKPESGHAYHKIQVAEQFHRKGSYQALKNLVKSGVIGEVKHIHMSVAHDYHAMSLMRFFLDDDTEPQVLCDVSLPDTLLRTHGRIGKLDDRKMVDVPQMIKVFQFQKATVVYDYTKEQYFSPIRKDRLFIRGTKGEIENDIVRYLNKDNEPVAGRISKTTSGLLDGFSLDKITFENRVLYQYSFPWARLSEEELAIAECLIGMKEFIESGKELYSFEKAYQDWKCFNL